MRVAAPTRERLLEAARGIVEERGYAGASVLAVADRAGVAAGTLYRHFDSKEQLLVELFRAACDRELLAMAAVAQRPADAWVDRIVNLLATFAERALRRPRLAWALLAEPVDPLVDAERLVYRERFRALLAHQLRGAIVAGELPEQDVELTAAALVGGCAEALVGPLAAGDLDSGRTIGSLRQFIRRAIGDG